MGALLSVHIGHHEVSVLGHSSLAPGHVRGAPLPDPPSPESSGALLHPGWHPWDPSLRKLQPLKKAQTGPLNEEARDCHHPGPDTSLPELHLLSARLV